MKYYTPIVFMFSYLTMAAALEGPKPEASRHVNLLAAMCEVESNCDSTKVGEANEIGMFTVGFTGKDGGKMKEICNIMICIPSKDTPRIQEAHILVGHIICQLIEEEIFPNA